MTDDEIKALRDAAAKARPQVWSMLMTPEDWIFLAKCQPAVFQARAELSRELGVRLVKGTSGDRDRVFLDELDPALDTDDVAPSVECSLLCQMEAPQ